MTETFDKLKAMLEEKGTVSDEDIKKLTEEHGELTAEENAWLSAELHARQRKSEKTVTMEQFLEANKVLDAAAPDSEEYKNAQKIVDAFLAGQ
ncbi:MAG: hypothetical protein GYB65_08550 [Chloroflexi bacterium]|nr:hypothetical protein [Chloroflexota bacterium]